MIYFVTRLNYEGAVRRLCKGLRGDLRTIKTTTYERLFRTRRAPVGHYVFTDHDRLSTYECEVVVAIAEQVCREDPRVQILNHPKQVLERFPLLKLLEKTGLNDFSITRLDDFTLPQHYPVFVRCEDYHMGTDTDLIQSEQELKEALAELRAKGKVLKRRVAVQFHAQKTEKGYYRKYGVINFNGIIIPQHIIDSHNWLAKSASRKRTEAIAAEELEFIRTNPHRDHLTKIFEVANIDYGRVDYGLVDGKIQVYEINTNPWIPRLDKESRIETNPKILEIRKERRKLIRQAALDAFQSLDVPLLSKSQIRYSFPSGAYHELPSPLLSRLRRRCRKRLRFWTRQNRSLAQRFPMRPWIRFLQWAL